MRVHFQQLTEPIARLLDTTRCSPSHSTFLLFPRACGDPIR
jgi:hypothetical protein